MAAAAGPRVKVDGGSLAGSSADGVARYLGIPFAAPPIGDLRWRAPASIRAWTGDRDATHSAIRCSAGVAGDGVRLLNEDCLYVDVYAPDDVKPDERLPVMVYLHGGGNVSGSPDIYDGSRMARVGRAIVVIPAYRLGIFGLLALPGLTHESADRASGDYGLLDQIAALKWVKQNIGSFGGNPDDVTLLGQSAGGTNACDLLVSPAATGLFARVIIQSGLCTMPIALKQAEDDGLAFAAKQGCADPETAAACLRGKDGGALMDAWSPGGLGLGQTPVGGDVLPEKPYEAMLSGKFPHVPVLVGFAQDEWWPFEHGLYPLSEAGYREKVAQQFGAKAEAVLAKYPAANFPHNEYALGAVIGDRLIICPSFSIADALAQTSPVSMYEFADRSVPPFKSLGSKQNLPPGYNPGAFHTAELQYLLGYKAAVRPLDAGQTALADRLIQLWVGFGRPDRAESKTWPAYDAKKRTLLKINAQADGGPAAFADSFASHQCDYWNANP
jgi:para-nitrobenzyl esterase